LAVPSNVGEPDQPPPAQQRELFAVVFGQSSFKHWFLRRHAAQTARICANYGIRRIVDIGPTRGGAYRELSTKGISIECTGVLPASDVSNVLGRAMLGFQTYYPGSLAKSGSLAALASHGVTTVLDADCPISTDALEPFQHYLPFEVLSKQNGYQNVSVPDLAQVGSRLHGWYQSHSSTHHARLFVEESNFGSQKKEELSRRSQA
jgi:hypothetical protein